MQNLWCDWMSESECIPRWEDSIGVKRQFFVIGFSLHGSLLFSKQTMANSLLNNPNKPECSEPALWLRIWHLRDNKTFESRCLIKVIPINEICQLSRYCYFLGVISNTLQSSFFPVWISINGYVFIHLFIHGVTIKTFPINNKVLFYARSILGDVMCCFKIHVCVAPKKD